MWDLSILVNNLSVIVYGAGTPSLLGLGPLPCDMAHNLAPHGRGWVLKPAGPWALASRLSNWLNTQRTYSIGPDTFWGPMWASLDEM